jgi:murein DD-endopeptidase MepM/ murein hydrolase activator NlpD
MEEKTKNKYRFPVEMTEGVIINYDESPAHQDNLKHSVDFIMDEDLPIYAALDGVVVDLKIDSNIGGEGKEFEPMGNFIEIKHENEEYSEYEHIRKDGAVVKLGDKVEKGQLIGYTGATGWLAHLGPHLHFMVGKYADENMDESTYQTIEIVWE